MNAPPPETDARGGLSARPWLLLLVALLPAIVGTALALAYIVGPLSLLTIVLRIETDSAYVSLGLGIGLSLILGLTFGAREWRRGSIARAIAAERQEASEAHRRFIRRLNHELKNPLTAVRAGLINVEAGRPAEARLDTGQRSLVNVRRQVDRLGRLADQLRKLADLEADDVERVPVDLADLVAEATELVADGPTRGTRQIVADVQQRPWPLGPVRGDRDLLLLALFNLLDNAMKFSEQGATIEIRAREDGARATIEVVDAGRGIAAEDLPHITEELYRGRDAQATEGSGLGLALVQRIAALHGGELRIRSRAGQGTVATLRLPLA